MTTTRATRHPRGTSRLRARRRLVAHRRAFAVLIVLWVVAIAAMIVVAVQAAAFRQAADGRESLARIRAKWAARAGLEAAITEIEFNTIEPNPSDALAIDFDLQSVAAGELTQATYSVRHSAGKQEADGPADAHAKLNINLLTVDDLLLLSNMTEDVADSVIDWIDADDETSPLGAESAYYRSLPNAYEPRNAPMRTIAELELVAGVRPEYVRGEDWNLNGILDPNEDDGNLSWPPDNRDGVLDAGWSALLTASSLDGSVYGNSGELKLVLATCSAADLAARTRVSNIQAEAILEWAASGSASYETLIQLGLPAALQATGITVQGLTDITTEQLAAVLAETVIEQPVGGDRPPGKLNINTCEDEVFDYIAALDPAMKDAIIYARNARAGGFNSITDLLTIPIMTRQTLATLYPLFDTRSNVYTLTSRGRDTASGIEVEIVATIDRSSLPASIRDILIR